MPASPYSKIFQRYPKTVLGIIVLVFSLILDFGLTSAYYLLAHGTIYLRVPRTEVRISSPGFHHTLKPNSFSFNEGWGHLHPAIYTNSLGFRDKTIREVPLKIDHYRILIIGDSFTEGVGYDFQQTFAGILSDTLSQKGIEVLNAGVVGYSPAIYFKKTEYLLEKVGLRFDHMLLFLDVSDISDEVKSYKIRDGQVDLTPEMNSVIEEFVEKHSTILRNLLKFFSKLEKSISDPEYRSYPRITRTPEEERYGIKHDRSMWTIDQSVLDAFGREGLVRAYGHMDLLFGLLTRYGIGLTVVVYPWPDQIFHHDLDSLQVRFWQGWAAKHSVKLINLFPDFIKERQDPKQVIAEYYIPGDTHFNDKSHQLVARRVLTELEPIVLVKHAIVPP